MKKILIAACGLAIASCNQGPEVSAENASTEDVARQVREAGGTGSFVRPGRWESKVTFEEMSMPGMPPEMAAQMKGLTGRVDTSHSCLTEEEAKRPKEDFFAGANKSCRYDHFNMGGGKIDAVMKCADQGATQVMTMKGTYSPDTYNMQMSVKADAASGPEGAMTMRMRVDAKRVGACDGSEEA